LRGYERPSQPRPPSPLLKSTAPVAPEQEETEEAPVTVSEGAKEFPDEGGEEDSDLGPPDPLQRVQSQEETAAKKGLPWGWLALGAGLWWYYRK
jgi:hypothetical protein